MFYRDINDSNFIQQNNILIIRRLHKINKINFNFFIVSIIILYFITLHGIFFLISEPVIKSDKNKEEKGKRDGNQ